MSKREPFLSVDTVLEILASAHRRRILEWLLSGADPPVERDELAEKLAAESSADLQMVEAVLAHHHLPQLADAGLVEYDHRSGGVRLDEKAADLEPLLELCQEWETVGD